MPLNHQLHFLAGRNVLPVRLQCLLNLATYTAESKDLLGTSANEVLRVQHAINFTNNWLEKGGFLDSFN